ncbi:MAG: hypothetical protein H3C62_03955 [Gemmatimonadaceae bacterium]|nr:hypothetical protein [Gemmatimonadaceae bacterium]
MLVPPLSALALAYVPWLLMLGGGLYLGLRLVRAFERRAGAQAEMAQLEARMLRLEENLANVGERLDRLADGQEFTTRLLAERK